MVVAGTNKNLDVNTRWAKHIRSRRMQRNWLFSQIWLLPSYPEAKPAALSYIRTKQNLANDPILCNLVHNDHIYPLSVRRLLVTLKYAHQAKSVI